MNRELILAGIAAASLSLNVDAQSPTALNDTGIIICYGPSSPCDPVLHKKQDAMVGRDAAARTPGSGLTTNTGKGFSFTKISRGGTAMDDNAVLGDTINDWACTRDNVTGLMWEVKTGSPTSSRYRDNSYTWYNPDSSKNGGNAGVPNGGACPIAGRCDTEKYIQDMRGVRICGKTNWRLPVPKELLNLLDLGSRAEGAPILTDFFPNPPTNTNTTINPSILFTSVLAAHDSSKAWILHVQYGGITTWFKSYPSGIMAVAGP